MLDCIGADDTGSAWIGIWIDTKRQKRKSRPLIKWRSRSVWCGVRQGRVHAELRKTTGAEKHCRGQAEAYKTSNVARESPTPNIASSPGNLKGVSRDVPVATEDATGTFPEIGDDNDIGFVISRSSLKPCLPLAHLIGCSEVCVPVAAPDLQPTELVNQKEVDHAGDRVGPIHRRRAVLQDIEVINHWKRNQINVHASAESDGVQRTKGDTFSVNQHQGFFRQQAAHVELHSAVPAIGDVQVGGSPRLLRQKSCQVRCIADAQLFDVCRSIRIDRIRADFFRSRNV